MVKLGSVRVQPVGLGLPPTVDQRLDQLLQLAYDGGHPTSRQRIVGALIRHSPTTAEEISALVLAYEGTEANDALIPGVSVAGTEDVKRPGRRKIDAGHA